MALELYNNLPQALNELLAEYVGGILLWERIQAKWNRTYALALTENDMNWNMMRYGPETIYRNWNPQESWPCNIMFAFEGNVRLLGLMFDENGSMARETGSLTY